MASVNNGVISFSNNADDYQIVSENVSTPYGTTVRETLGGTVELEISFGEYKLSCC